MVQLVTFLVCSLGALVVYFSIEFCDRLFLGYYFRG